jgi:hypothetical protein
MTKVLQYVLRFGPLVAGLALGLTALVSIWVPGYAGILNQILSVLAFVGVQPDQNIVAELGNLVAGVLVLIGGARKLWSLLVAYADSL